MIIVLIACNPNKDYNTYLKLQGDWTAGYERTFLFKDTLCNYLTPFGSFTGFRVRDDTIICKTKYLDNRSFKEIKFYILRLDEDSLEVEYKNPYSKRKEILIFSKIKAKSGNNTQIDSVIYLLALDNNHNPISSRDIKYLNDSTICIKDDGYFKHFNKSSKEYYTLNKKDFDFINQKSANIDYKQVEEYSSEFVLSNSDEDPVVRIYLTNKLTKNKSRIDLYNLYINSCVRSEDDYPNELKIFLNYLDNISYFIK